MSLDGNGNVAVACIRSRIKQGTAVVYCGANELDRYALRTSISLNKAPSAILSKGIKGLIVSDLYEEGY